MTPSEQQCALGIREFHLPSRALFAVQTDTWVQQAQKHKISEDRNKNLTQYRKSSHISTEMQKKNILEHKVALSITSEQ